MSMLGSVLGGLLGGGNSPMGSILGSILGGGGSQASSQPSSGGGLQDLIEKLGRAGLGHVGSSWVGTGENASISPGQLHDVFGQNQIDQWSQQSGLPQNDILSQLSNLLPHAVNHMTPDGQMPSSAERSPFDDAGTALPPSR